MEPQGPIETITDAILQIEWPDEITFADLITAYFGAQDRRITENFAELLAHHVGQALIAMRVQSEHGTMH